MNYQFDEQEAIIYGVDAAVMIYNIRFWIRKNAANGHNFHDGRFWTYNSVEAFAKLFPFWSAGQVRRILSKLIDAGVLQTGNFSDNRQNRTTWYAFTDEYLSENDREGHLSKSTNAFVENDKCIVDNIYIQDNIYTDNKPDNMGGKPPKRTSNTVETLCLFANSRYSDFEAFASEFGAPEFQGVDILYYFNAVADWSSQGAKKKHDWIATARNFMRGDAGKGQLKMARKGLSEIAQEYMKYRF